MGRFYVKLLLACFVFMYGLGEVLAAKLPQTQSQAVLHDSTRLRLCAASVEPYYKNHQFDSLLIAIKTSFELSKKLHTTRFHAELYLYYGLWYRFHKQVDQSLKMFQLALTFGKRSAQRTTIQWAGYQSAIAYSDLAYRTGSIEAHRRCVKQLYENIELANNMQSSLHLVYNYSLLASIYQGNGNDSLATFYLEKQSPFLKRLPGPNNQLYFLTNAVEIALYKKNFQDTQKYLNQFLQFHHQEKYWEDYQYLLFDLIGQFIHYGKFDQAFKLIQMVKNTPKLMKALDTNSKFLFYHDLATIYLERKQYAFAQKAYEQALFFSKKEFIVLSNQLKLLIIQQKLLENQGQFKQALSLLKVIQQRKDSITFNQFNSEIVSSQESLKQEEKQLALQQQLNVEKLKQQLKTKELENLYFLQRIYLFIIVFITGILILISYQIYWIRKQASIIKQVNERLHQLMAIIGHDLRSPIASLLGSLSQMSDANEVIKNQIPAINNLLLTTDNLLYWAHSQKDSSLKLYPQVVALQEIIDEVLALYEINIETAQINIQIEVSPQVEVRADENHLRIIVRNLIQNALKYTLSGGRIFISTQLLPDSNNLIIENTSSGAELNQAYRKKQGLGLGLKLVEELMRMNQGDLVFTQGTDSFTVVLKFAKVA